MTTESNIDNERPMLDTTDVLIPDPGSPLARALCALLRCRRVNPQVFEAMYGDWALKHYVYELHALGWPIVQEGDCYRLEALYEAELADTLDRLIVDCSELELQYTIGLIAGEESEARSDYALH